MDRIDIDLHETVQDNEMGCRVEYNGTGANKYIMDQLRHV